MIAPLERTRLLEQPNVLNVQCAAGKALVKTPIPPQGAVLASLERTRLLEQWSAVIAPLERTRRLLEHTHVRNALLDTDQRREQPSANL